jgi:hypothetical protein
MLRCGQTTIDLNKLSDNALAITRILVDESQVYKNRCLALLDPFLTPIDEPFMKYFHNQLRLYKVPISHPSVLKTKCPWLIELDLRDKYEQAVLSFMLDRALKQLAPQSIAVGTGQQYCAWLFTHKKTESIAKDLGLRTIQKRGRDKNILLRYYDPAVFFQLMSILDSNQQNKLLGNIEKWAMLTRQGTLNIKQQIEPVQFSLMGSLWITTDQHQKLDCIGINNQIIRSEQIKHPAKNIDEIQSLQKITPCLIRLMNNNIHEKELKLEWAKLALKWGHNFDCHPKIKSKIKQCTDLGKYYRLLGELNKIRSDDWQIYLQELNEK